MKKRSVKIRYDWANLRAELAGSGQGLTEADLQAHREQARGAVERVRGRVDKGEIGFPHLPFDKQTRTEVEGYARRRRGKYKHVLLLGIGGSALGPFALDVVVNGPRPFRRKKVPAELIVVDNVDPLILGRALEELDPRKTLVLVITKSGSTAETMSQFLIVYHWLQKKVGKKKAAAQIAVVTDPKKGDLLDIARKEGFETFSIPPNVGGRFSALTPVGLLPAALAGANVRELLAGAADILDECRAAELEQNPALAAALHQYLLDTRYGKSIQVVYCYSNALYPLAFWYRQLWAESLGKRLDRHQREVFAGQTPIAALGVTDQHSQSQLYMEGPRDKTFTFWAVEKDPYTVKIPKRFSDRSSTGYLGGHTMNELFNTERFATELALTEAGRPNSTFYFPRADEYAVGQFMMLAMFQTAYAGEFYDVNAYDQPGVELGKQLTYGKLGRGGFDAERQRIEAYRKQKEGLEAKAGSGD